MLSKSAIFSWRSGSQKSNAVIFMVREGKEWDGPSRLYIGDMRFIKSTIGDKWLQKFELLVSKQNVIKSVVP